MNDIQRKLTYNTCLICGIRTSQLVNIFEEGRGGPNLVDVIYEKYNIKAENDTEKFLCYSCNNWLINWWSLQHKNDQTNNQPHSSSNSPSKSERNRNEKRYTSKTEKENEQKRRPNFPVEVVVGESRPVLVDRHQNVENVVSSTTNNDTFSSSFQLKRRQKPYAKKYKCSFDRCNTRFSTYSARREHLTSVHHEKETRKYLLMPMNENTSEQQSSALRNILDSNIVEMLLKQGTQITLEAEEEEDENYQQKFIKKPKRSNNNCKKQVTTKNDTNEILLSFDYHLTEVMLGNILADDTSLLSEHRNGLIVSP